MKKPTNWVMMYGLPIQSSPKISPEFWAQTICYMLSVLA
jgi:hypothetical protein